MDMSADPAIIELLHQAGMRRTSPRQAVLELLHQSPVALSHQHLEEQLNGQVDRVTIYRILSAFEEKGLVHRILDPEGQPLYALCSSDCGAGHHHDEHLHFHCDDCGGTYCLDTVAMPQLKLPKGFQMRETRIDVRGRCPKCAV
jgi:Fur family ferric uptake transcriptional regulator